MNANGTGSLLPTIWLGVTLPKAEFMPTYATRRAKVEASVSATGKIRVSK